MDSDHRFGDGVDAVHTIDGVVTGLHGAIDRIFDREQGPVSRAVGECGDDIAKVLQWYTCDVGTPQLANRLLTEGGDFSLVCDAKRCGHGLP